MVHTTINKMANNETTQLVEALPIAVEAKIKPMEITIGPVTIGEKRKWRRDSKFYKKTIICCIYNRKYWGVYFNK